MLRWLEKYGYVITFSMAVWAGIATPRTPATWPGIVNLWPVLLFLVAVWFYDLVRGSLVLGTVLKINELGYTVTKDSDGDWTAHQPSVSVSGDSAAQILGMVQKREERKKAAEEDARQHPYTEMMVG
jgi:hypothetical protein